MAMRDQDEIDMFERSDFCLRVFKNRIREPRIYEQNFSARGHNLERRLTVPSELRIHANHQIENRWSSKRNAVARSDGCSNFSTFAISSSFDIGRSSSYLCLHI